MKAVQNKKNHAGSIMLFDHEVKYKAIVIKTARYQLKKKHIDQWKKIENLNVNLQIHSQLMFDKGAKCTHWRKDHLFDK